MSEAQPLIKVYSTTWCSDCKRAKRFFGEQRIPYLNLDIEEDQQAKEYVESVNDGKHIIPTIVFPDGSILVEPSNAQLAEKLRLHIEPQRDFYDVVVIGGGPSGLTAALYLAREGLDTLVVERGGLGGQVGLSQRMDNFPGFDEGISGAEFGDRLARQAARFGVEILQATEISSLSPQGPYMCSFSNRGKEFGSKAVLLTTGAHYRRLNVPGEDDLIGSSVHFCATCDGVFYQDKKLLVVGGGNSGFEEGIFLKQFASQVDIVEIQPRVRASKILQEKVAETPNMSVYVNHAIRELKGRNHLDSIVVENLKTGEFANWKYDGIFVFVGLSPNHDLVKGKVDLDANGFVLTDRTLMTSQRGLFAAGDVRAGSTKQAAAAAGEGVTAALMIREYLKEMG